MNQEQIFKEREVKEEVKQTGVSFFRSIISLATIAVDTYEKGCEFGRALDKLDEINAAEEEQKEKVKLLEVDAEEGKGEK